MAEDDDDSGRCWPGYEPVPGKSPHEQGSCRPKAASKLSPKERKVREGRRQQLDERPRRTEKAMPPPEGVSEAHSPERWREHREEEVRRTGEQKAEKRRTPRQRKRSPSRARE